jgi:RNA polymerase sigma-70 factor (ECF subfamily)
MRSFSQTGRVLQDKGVLPVSLAELSDDELLKEYKKNGRDEGIEEIERRYRPRLRGLFKRWKLQEADVQDLVQQVFLEAIRSVRLGPYKPQGLFWSWLVKIASRRFASYLKKRLRQPLSFEVTEDLGLETSREDDPAELTCGNELEVALIDCLRELPEVDQQTLVLRSWDDLEDAEIAARLGKTANHVRVIRCRAMDKLLEALKRRGFGGTGTTSTS